MKKRLAFLVSVFVFGVFVAFNFAQSSFRVHRKFLANLPYDPYDTVPNAILITDLDGDRHSEVMVITTKPSLSIWVRSPFGKPSHIRLTNIQHLEWGPACECDIEEAGARLKKISETPLRALPVLVAGNRLRLLRWRGKQAVFERLSPLPDVPIKDEDALVWQGRGTGNIFLRVVNINNCDWFFVLTPKGEWRFIGKWREVDSFFIADIADIDRDGRPDLLAFREEKGVCILWGGQKDSANLGTYGSLDPLVTDLDLDSWMEVITVAKDKRLRIWRFDQKQRNMRLISASSPFSFSDLADSDELHLVDLDGDEKKEIIVPDDRGSAVVQFRGGKVRVWKGKAGKIFGVSLFTAKGQKFYKSDIVTKSEKDFTILWVLPKGKRALSPFNWRLQEVPIRFEFVGDIDGNGSDEVLGYDSRWQCYRLYRVYPTKSGLLRWEGVSLGKDIAFPLAFALIKDGNRRGLVMAVETKRQGKVIGAKLELLTMESRR